jgi:hypothetical protein
MRILKNSLILAAAWLTLSGIYTCAEAGSNLSKGKLSDGSVIDATAIWCANNDGTASVCNFGGGGGGGTVSQGTAAAASGAWPEFITVGGVAVGAGNPLSVSDASLLAALGSPFQAGGSIGNTTFAVTNSALGITQSGAIAGATGVLSMAETLNAAPSFSVSTANPLVQNVKGALSVTFAAMGTPTNANPSASAIPSSTASGSYSPLIIAAYNSTPLVLANAQSAQLAENTAAQLYIDNEGLKTSYRVSGAITLAATPTDVFVLPGSASKTVRLRRLRIYSAATTAGTMTLSLVKRSAADTGGTSTATTVVPLDSADAAGSAAPLTYTANPSALGTALGSVDTALIDFGLTASGPVFDETFGQAGAQTVVLRGVAQNLAINLNGGTLPTGAQFSYVCEYTEE